MFLACPDLTDFTTESSMSGANVKIAANGDDHRDICQSIEAICDQFPAKYWRDLEDAPANERYPENFVKTLEESGFMSALVPEDYDGVGLPMGAAAKIVETIHACGGNGSVFIVQNRLVQLLSKYASDDMKRSILPRIASGAVRLQSLAVFEPGCGENLDLIETRATKKKDGWVINGKKRWVYYVDKSDFMLLLARSGDERGQISLFLVDVKKHLGHGIQQRFIDSMNNNGGSDIVLEGLELDEASVVGCLNDAATYLHGSQAIESILAAAAAYGDTRFFSRKAANYAKERVVFGNPIGKYQGIQFPIARTYIESQAAEVSLQLALALWEAGQDCRSEAIIAHHLAANAAWDSADAAFTTHGGFAFAREYDIERKWREARAMRNTVAAALPYVAETVLGLPHD
jgi:acyl-CoA dehydrogenase